MRHFKPPLFIPATCTGLEVIQTNVSMENNPGMIEYIWCKLYFAKKWDLYKCNFFEDSHVLTCWMSKHSWIQREEAFKAAHSWPCLHPNIIKFDKRNLIKMKQMYSVIHAPVSFHGSLNWYLYIAKWIVLDGCLEKKNKNKQYNYFICWKGWNDLVKSKDQHVISTKCF